MEYVPELFYFPNRFCYTKQGEKKEETIGILHGEKAVLTLLTDPYTNTGKLKVEGFC